LRTRLALIPALLAALAGLAGCGSKSVDQNRIAGTTLTIYSSAPMHGPSSVSAEAVVSGAKLALADVSGRIGRYRIVLKSLDDSTVQRGTWDPGQTTVNARLAAQDRTAIGYIGEFNSGASAISIPLLNRAGIPQISPASTAVGLTTSAAGASPGEPQKYYPTGVRTYARVVPNDAVQAAAQVQLQLSVGCSMTYLLTDGGVDGLDTATSFELAARPTRLQLVGNDLFDPKATDYSSLAATVANSGANCVFVSALTDSNAALLTKQVAAAAPSARIFGSAGVAESTYTDPDQGGIPPAIDPRVLITVAALGPAAYPPSGRAFLASYQQLYGSPQPYAIFGYEAMGLMLDAIRRATDGGTATAERSKVVKAIFATRDRHGAIGTYSIDRNGDTTLARYGVYKVIAGRLRFWRAIAT
jgi:branched-chain amino acid transport system substrate-binding protein